MDIWWVFLFCFISRSGHAVGVGNGTCSPLNENAKASVDTYRSNSGKVPLVFWHVQKSGGTTFCRLMREDAMQHRQWTPRKRDTLTNNCKGNWRTVFRNGGDPGKLSHFVREGHPFVAFEPADEYKAQWPQAYQTEMKTLGIFMDDSPLWTAVPHILLLRHPLQRAMSAFTYKFWGWSTTAHQACLSHGLTTDACLQAAFTLKHTGKYDERMWTQHQANVVLHQVVGSFLTDHLSQSGTVDDSISTLQRFALILDLSYPSSAAFMSSCVLGWSNISPASFSEKHNAQSTNDTKHNPVSDGLLREISRETRRELSTFLTNDERVYRHAIHLMQQHYERARREVRRSVVTDAWQAFHAQKI